MRIIGAGGKSGGGDARVAVEDPDSLQSHQFAKVIDLISEGPIGGLVDGLRSVYLDDTPVQSADGTMNFTGLTLSYRNGTNDQSAIEGFTDVENESSVNAINIPSRQVWVDPPRSGNYDHSGPGIPNAGFDSNYPSGTNNDAGNTFGSDTSVA